MPRYTIRLHVIINGLSQIQISDHREFNVGDQITINPTMPMRVESPSGFVELSPGVGFSGVIAEKSYF